MSHWYHSPQCCECKICKGQGCFIWTDGHASLHICARGCDGIPERVGGLL